MRLSTVSKVIVLTFVLGAAGCPPREKKEEHKPGDGHDHGAASSSADAHKPDDGYSKDEKR